MIQQEERQGWDWMHRTDPAIETVVNAREIVSNEIEYIHPDTASVYLKSAGPDTAVDLQVVDYDTFRSITKNQSYTGEPSMIALTPAKNIALDPIPDDIYVVNFEYQKRPQTLTDNTDEPELWPEYHDIIVSKALILFGGYESAPETLQTGTIAYQMQIADLKANHRLHRARYDVIVPE